MRNAILAVIMACVVSHSKAGVRAWWHFEDLPAGTQTSQEDVCLNSVDPNAFQGIPCEQSSAVITSGGARMPTYLAAFPDGHYLYDPVTDTVHTNTTAIWCGSVSSNATGRSGCVIVDDHGLYGDAFTIEFLIRCAKYQGTTWETFLTRLDSDGKVSLLFRSHYGAFKGEYAFITNNVRTKVAFKDFNCWKHGDLLDENWHHIAISVDQVGLEMKMYVDYQLSETVALPGRLDMDGEGTLRLGIGTENWGGNFSGFIDELRVSDEVLPAGKFLRAQRMDSPSVLYCRSFSPYAGEFGDGNMLRNELTTTLASGGSESMIAPSDSAASIRMHSGAAEMENDAAVNFRKACFSVPCSDAALQTGDFTIESMIRLPAGEISGEHYLFQQGVNLLARFNGDRTLDVRKPNWAAFTTVAVNDDKWHHVAYVVDRTNGRIGFYFDYSLVRAENYSMPEFAADSLIWVGGYNGTSLTFASIDMDEFRLTRTALGTDDFIHPVLAGGSEETSCRISFDPADFARYGYGFGLTAVTRFTWGSFSIDDTDRPGATIYDGKLDRVGQTNRVSAGFSSSGNFGGFYRIEDRAESPIADGSFTAEVFVKLGSKSCGGVAEANPCFLGQLNRFGIEFWHWEDNVVAVDSRGTSFAKAAISTKKWYHLAYVKDVEADQLRFYVNRKLIGTKEGIPTATAETNSGIYLMGSPKKEYYGTFLSARADEVRLTAMALSPAEFLTSDAPRGLSIIVR